MRAQIDPNWGPKGLDWSNRAEVQDLYSALVQQVWSVSLHSCSAGRSPAEAPCADNLSTQQALPNL